MLPFEDQLDREERLRCEALGLAIQFAQAQHHGKPRPSRAGDTIESIAAEVHELADEFRKYIEDGLPAVVDEDEAEDPE